MKFNIFKSFDIFNSEAVSVLKEAIVKFMHIETDYYAEGSAITAELKEDCVTLTIVNQPKVFNLMTLAWYRQKKRLENENNQSRVHQKC